MSVLDENRIFILFKKQGMFRPPCYINPYGKVRILGENMEKIETTIFVDWENLLTDLRAIQKKPPKQTSVLRSLILVSTTPSSSYR